MPCGVSFFFLFCSIRLLRLGLLRLRVFCLVPVLRLLLQLLRRLLGFLHVLHVDVCFVSVVAIVSI